MRIYIVWEADTQQAAQIAAMTEKPEEIRRIARNVEAGNRIWESWLLRIGGELVAYVGNEGQAKVPADRLDEIGDIRRQYQDAIGDDGRVSVGVGVKLDEAMIALQAARKRGGERPVLYTDEVAREVQNDEEEQDLLEPVAKADFSTQFNASTPSAGEATKISQGQLSPTAAMPSAMAGSPSGSPQQQMLPAPGGMAPAQPGQDLTRLKQGVVTVLKQAQQLTPMLEQIKGQNPDLYNVINGSVQAMIEMARALFGNSMQKSVMPARFSEMGPPPGEDLDKEETSGESSSEDSGEFSSEPTEKAEVKDVPKLDEVPKRHHLKLPPGSEHNGKIKVIHSTGDTSFVSVRAGRIQSGDPVLGGHGISSKQPKAR